MNLSMTLSFQSMESVLHTYAKLSRDIPYLAPSGVCVSGGYKYYFFGKICLRTNWMISIYKHEELLLLTFTYILVHVSNLSFIKELMSRFIYPKTDLRSADFSFNFEF